MISIVVLFGLIIGSFLNAVVYRSSVPNGRPISEGRSLCPKCGKTLKWRELVPVLSFAIQGGKCRGCKEKISWQYPIVEILTAAVFALAWNFYLNGQILIFQNKFLFYVFAAIIFCLAADLIAIFVYDLKYLEIPMSFLLWGIGFSVFAAIIRDIDWIFFRSGTAGQTFLKIFAQSSFGSGILGALAAGGFFFALVAISRERWMGQGDIYVGAIIGMALGWPQILEALIIAFAAGALIGIVLIIARLKQLASKIAFGPFLVFAFFVVLFFGQEIFNWYLNFLLR